MASLPRPIGRIGQANAANLGKAHIKDAIQNEQIFCEFHH
jgi:hypothetical protein